MGKPVWLVRTTVVLVSGLYSLALYLSGVALLPFLAKLIAALPAIAVVILFIWDVWLWRAPLLQRATKRPYLAGLWRVTYEPTQASHIPEGGNRGPIAGFLVIKQSFWNVSVRSLTKESKSDSRSFFWELELGGDVSALVFTYENVPKAAVSHRSTRHLGATQLDPASLRPLEMEGVYFTDRYTKGDMRAEYVGRSTGYGSFGAALKAVTE